jgi:hypothetical protein
VLAEFVFADAVLAAATFADLFATGSGLFSVVVVDPQPAATTERTVRIKKRFI